VVKEVGVGGVKREMEWKMSNSTDGGVKGNFSLVRAEWGKMSGFAYSAEAAKIFLALSLLVTNGAAQPADDILEGGIRVWGV
jgi:hypothetical protein